MSQGASKNPFKELPVALVVDMLNQCEGISKKLSQSFQRLLDLKAEARLKLKENDLLKKESAIISTTNHPTTCGVDGAFAVEKLLSTDIVAIAGVAVEGLAPPSEKKHWPIPHHDSNIFTLSHDDSTSILSGAIMMCIELLLASSAPHDVVFLDGSIITPFVYLIKAINLKNGSVRALSDELEGRLEESIKSYEKILISKRSDQIFAAVPKYTTHKVISRDYLNFNEFEDRGLLSFILKAGEFVGPIQFKSSISDYEITNVPSFLRDKFKRVVSAINDINIIYYRPYSHFPVLRLEVSPSVTNNIQRIATVFEAIKLQCGVPGIMEPYPLYLADRMVKHLRKALPAIRKTTTQEMAFKWNGAPDDIYFAMHAYRTDWAK